MGFEFISAKQSAQGGRQRVMAIMVRDTVAGVEAATITSFPQAIPPFATVAIHDVDPFIYRHSYEEDPQHALLVVQSEFSAKKLLDTALRARESAKGTLPATKSK